MKDAYIIDSIRTPIGKFGGTLAPVRADDLAALPITELVKRNPSLNPEDITDVILGCANQAGEDNRNVARMALLLAGLPYSVPGETVNRLCSSGLSSCVHAARAIQLGDGDVYIGGGMEHMTRGPFVISKASKPFGRDAEFHDSSFGWRFVNKKMHSMYGTDGMGVTAENVAEKYKVNREDQDQFAVWSQQKATTARESGRLAKEIVPVEIPRRKMDPLIFSEDEFIRPGTSVEALAKLRAVFRTDGKGSVTAGNASGLNDGACAVLLASEEGAKRNNLTPRARFVSSAVVGLEPRIMGMGPVKASQQALKKAGLTIDDISIIELNEAFAAQSLACTRELGLEDNDPRINPNGGAIAIGHPLGMSGARLLGSAVIDLHEKNGRYALITMCVGVGQGMAAIIERV
ncbi:MAG: 3-oxoadipyl-CoA thiolase [Calditrichia bacterium]